MSARGRGEALGGKIVKDGGGIGGHDMRYSIVTDGKINNNYVLVPLKNLFGSFFLLVVVNH